MSRGFGALQRRILETLDEAKAAAPRYPGAAHDSHTRRYTLVRLGTAAGRVEGRLPPGVYDLRCCARYLAEEDGHLSGLLDIFATPGFTASFSRAAHALFRRGAIKQYFPDVPLRDAMRWNGWAWSRLGDWTTVPCGRQLRFITLSANSTYLALSYADLSR